MSGFAFRIDAEADGVVTRAVNPELSEEATIEEQDS